MQDRLSLNSNHIYSLAVSKDDGLSCYILPGISLSEIEKRLIRRNSIEPFNIHGPMGSDNKKPWNAE